MSSSYFLHSTQLSSSTKLWLLIRKNKSLHCANPINTIFIILTPVVIFLLSQVEHIVNAKSDEKVPETRYPHLELNQPNVTSIMYSPLNHVVEQIVKDTAASFGSPKLKSYLYASEMDKALTVEDAYVGIEFEDHLRDIMELPSKVKVAIRYPLHLRTNQRGRWPHRLFKRIMENPDKDAYHTEGFLWIQLKLSEAIIRSVNKSVLMPQIHIQPFPDAGRTVFPDLPRKFRKFVISFVLIYMFPSLIICQMIVSEKQDFMRDMMYIMGLPIGLNWLSWFIVSYIMLMIPTVFVVIMIMVFLCPYSSSIVVLFIFMVYIFALISLTFMVSSFFNNSFLAMIAMCIVHVISFMPFFVVNGRDTGTINSLIVAFHLNSAMPMILIQIFAYEMKSWGIQWSNLFLCSHPDDRLSSGHILVPMILLSILFILICLYVDQIKPAGLRPGKQFNFPFTRKFWCSSPPTINFTESDEEAAIDAGNRNENVLAFENATSENEVIINSQRLSKSFGDEKVVRNFTLKFYENEITVLLGDTGAGKTTIFMMLVGLYAPTSGRVLINGEDMVEAPRLARKSISLCPQKNIFFEELSSFWHITFYSQLKGMSHYHAEQEAEAYLLKMNLKDKAKMKVKHLSAAMRRKLSLCCALCAGTKVVLCDEPSAFLDPAACRDVFDLLRREKDGRCIILNTHSFTPAAVLGDRIGIISDGEIIGYGTSDFLIDNLGPGYRVVCAQLTDCDVNKVTKLLQRFIPEARVEKFDEYEITYRLPIARVHRFPNLFRALERKLGDLKLSTFTVSAPTMEETILKINANKNGRWRSVVSDAKWVHGANDIQESNKRKRLENKWRAMLLKKLLYSRQHLITLTCIILLPIFVAAANISVDIMDADEQPKEIPSFTNFDSYVDPTVVKHVEGRSIGLGYGEELEDNTRRICEQYDDEVMAAGATLHIIQGGVQNYLVDNLDVAAETYKRVYVAAATFREGSITAWFNRRLLHGIPITVSILYKAIGNSMANTDIEIINKPRNDTDEVFLINIDMNDKKNTSLLMFFLCISLALFIRQPIQERALQMKQQQHIAGITVYTYWLSHLIYDYLILQLLSVAVIFSLYMKSHESLCWLWIILMAFDFAALSFTYLLSFAFREPHVAMTVNILFNVLIVIVAIITVGKHLTIMHYILLLLPFYAMYSASIAAISNGHGLTACEAMELGSVCTENCSLIEHEPMNVWTELIYMLASGIFYFILVLLYSKLRALKYFIKYNRANCESNFADEDVKIMSQEVQYIINDDDLLKECSLVCDRIKKKISHLLPVECISFRIMPYECFGLMGLSGAGKTCIFDMVIGSRNLSQGNIYIKGLSMKNQRHKCFSHIGFCPQSNSIFPYMTGREMLTFACLIRGMQRKLIPDFIVNLADGFLLTKYLDQQTMYYSNGNQRKLAIAIASLSPTLICLDCPFTGVDVNTKHEISSVLSQLRSNGKSLFITSDSIAECEVLCTYLAIMAHGNLCCIGNAPYLKTRFNRGISIKIQVATKDEMDEINNDFDELYINFSRATTTSLSPMASASSSNRNGSVITAKADEEEEESSLDKGVQVKMKKKPRIKQKPSAKRNTPASEEDIFIEKQTERGTIIVKRKKTSAISATEKTIKHAGSSLLNIYIATDDRNEYSKIIKTVERRFRINFPNSYVTERFIIRGLVTVIIPEDPENDLLWSEIFQFVEDNRTDLQIKHYSISETTLEDIFLNFARN
ncbi:phospholipid-transporting ATPase ABCA1 isoform X1 [Drosophila albomicans]|uniref:Phospholipid-transporting ATPase ABCA1 isoform X1 n=2 Tax=Drosophila albomicans TaxID=7291 RepID=A0A6P8XY49_DROAB|nr:phospholipid-transporting ATPase ABCA1 isoform X1 [Drosophila albomicans]